MFKNIFLTALRVLILLYQCINTDLIFHYSLLHHIYDSRIFTNSSDLFKDFNIVVIFKHNA